MRKPVLPAFLLFIASTALNAGFLYEISEADSPTVSPFVTITGWDDPSTLPENLTIPDTLPDPNDPNRDIPVERIADYAFQDSSLVSVVFGNNISRIGLNAFKGSESLETVTLNDGLENIQSEAFRDCKKTFLTYSAR